MDRFCAFFFFFFF